MDRLTDCVGCDDCHEREEVLRSLLVESEACAWALDNHGAYLGVRMPHIDGWHDEDGSAHRRFPPPDEDGALLDGWIEAVATTGSHGVVWTWRYWLEEDLGAGMQRVGRPDVAPSLLWAVRMVEGLARSYRAAEAERAEGRRHGCCDFCGIPLPEGSEDPASGIILCAGCQ